MKRSSNKKIPYLQSGFQLYLKRIKIGLKTSEMADKLRLSTQRYKNLEMGLDLPSLDENQKIEDFLTDSPSKLLTKIAHKTIKNR